MMPSRRRALQKQNLALSINHTASGDSTAEVLQCSGFADRVLMILPD